ncbi:MAG: ATP-binding protein [Alphaproteobacteria bacterium]
MLKSMSARLLVLTILFVMLAEVMIFVPSIASFRVGWFEERLAAAQLASLSLEATPDADISPELEEELLANAMVKAVILKREATRSLMLSDEMPAGLDATYDLRGASMVTLIQDAMMTLVNGPENVIQVTGAAQVGGGEYVAIILEEEPLHDAMLAYARNILILSLIISIFTAALIYLTLFRYFVRPMQRIQQNMERFSAAPEDPRRIIEPSDRQDEIGTVERELQAMQEQVRQSLAQKARLANLGEAVAKINHDLRNMLTTAQLVSERMARSEDPKVQKASPMLVSAVGRAIDLCAQTLKYGKSEDPKPRPILFELSPLVDEIASSVGLNGQSHPVFVNKVPANTQIEADPDHVFRALQNLIRNARQALGETDGEVSVSAREENGNCVIDVADTGPGLPKLARDNLFKPFVGSTTKGGSGLGLVNVQEIMRAHGGDITLFKSDDSGTIFRMSFPYPGDVAAQQSVG